MQDVQPALACQLEVSSPGLDGTRVQPTVVHVVDFDQQGVDGWLLRLLWQLL